MELNEQQQQVVNAVEGSWVVISGPGSGKTTCMVERFLGMLTSGIPMNDILNLTFTSSAAETAAEKVGITNAAKVFRTFHSFCLELIKKERGHLPFKLGDTVIPVRGEDNLLLIELLKENYKLGSFKKLREKISQWKRSNIEPEQAIAESSGDDTAFAVAYEEYESRCRKQGWLDFDSLIRETVKLLETNQDVRNRWRKKYISVDESQDTDITQFKLLQLLFGGNIMAVGDENQLIYEWRSAQSGNLTNFSRTFPGAKTLYLGHNYRSTKRLVDFLKEIIPVDNGIASYMKTDNEDGVEPELIHYPDSESEANDVLTEANKDPENSVIIARTNRQLFEVQRIAATRNIKYKNLGARDFWDQNEVKALLSYAKEYDQNSAASVVLSRVVGDHNLHYRYRNSGDDHSNPIENIEAVVKIATAKGYTMAEFSDYLRRLTYGRKSRKEKDLTLATVHLIKGQERDNVFLIGAQQGTLPHKNGEIAEERRIFFVACSRAAKRLQISWYENRSEFLSGRDYKRYFGREE